MAQPYNTAREFFLSSFRAQQIYRIKSLHPPVYFVAVAVKVKQSCLQSWSGPEGSRKLRFPDFMTTAQDGGKVVSSRHNRLYSQEIHLVLISVRG